MVGTYCLQEGYILGLNVMTGSGSGFATSRPLKRTAQSQKLFALKLLLSPNSGIPNSESEAL